MTSTAAFPSITAHPRKTLATTNGEVVAAHPQVRTGREYGGGQNARATMAAAYCILMAQELDNSWRDPNEWDSLAGTPAFDQVKKKLRAAAPESFANPGPEINELKMVTAGERFHRETKPRKRQ
jgi:hypothetical protein